MILTKAMSAKKQIEQKKALLLIPVREKAVITLKQNLFRQMESTFTESLLIPGMKITLNV